MQQSSNLTLKGQIELALMEVKDFAFGAKKARNYTALCLRISGYMGAIIADLQSALERHTPNLTRDFERDHLSNSNETLITTRAKVNLLYTTISFQTELIIKMLHLLVIRWKAENIEPVLNNIYNKANHLLKNLKESVLPPY
ncbi:MAG: hypothetical protein KTR20_00110 [Cellvibrionaceae bacterium]|nr:hypothetical protein [Cellvibrionaceae bacterium]